MEVPLCEDFCWCHGNCILFFMFSSLLGLESRCLNKYFVLFYQYSHLVIFGGTQYPSTLISSLILMV